MGHVHVTHLKASTFAGQTTWAKGRYTALVGDFGQRVGLVHELRQLRRTEELLQRRRNRLGVDQVVRHQRVLLCLTQTFLHSLFDTGQTRAVLVFGQFAHAANTAVTQVVDIVHFATAIAQVHQQLDHGQDVFVGQHHGAGRTVTAHTGVELHAAYARQVVGIWVVEQAVEQGLHGVLGRRLARAHHAVDGHTCCELVHGLIGTQGLRNIRTLVQFVRVDALHVLDAGAAQLFQQRFCQLFIGLGNDFASVRVNDVLGQYAANQEVFRDADKLGARLLQLTGVTCSDALVLGNHDLA